jgi:hypothetical protein
MNTKPVRLGLKALAVAAMLGLQPDPASAAWYDCYDDQFCPFHTACWGDFYSWTDLCEIQCWENVGGGQVNPLGTAICS